MFTWQRICQNEAASASKPHSKFFSNGSRMISCSQYDYIEIVCMFNYPIELTLKSGGIVEGTALDTATSTQHDECIKVLVGKNEQLVVLDNIAQLKVLVENPHFCHVSFD